MSNVSCQQWAWGSSAVIFLLLIGAARSGQAFPSCSEHALTLHESSSPDSYDDGERRIVQPSSLDWTKKHSSKDFCLSVTVQNHTARTRWVLGGPFARLEEFRVEYMDSQRIEPSLGAFPKNTLGTLAVGFPIEIPSHQTSAFRLYVSPHFSSRILPESLLLSTPERFAKKALRFDAVVFFALGVICALTAYVLIIWLTTRKSMFAWYGVVGVSTSVFWASHYRVLEALFGYGTDSGWIKTLALYMALTASLGLASELLEVKTYLRPLARVFQAQQGAIALSLPVIFVANEKTGLVVGAVHATGMIATILSTNIWSLYKGSRSARLFALAWIATIFAGAAMALDELHIWNVRAVDVRLSTLAATAWAMVVMAKSVSDQIRVLNIERQRAEVQAYTDALTGLGNRAALDTKLDTLAHIAGQDEWDAAVIFIDLDGLKPINDDEGHARGDQLLRETAASLVESFRTSDIVYRLGGDEFVVLLDQLRAEQEFRLQSRLSSVATALREVGFGSIGVSYGMARISETEGDPHRALRLADKRMYANKAAKRQR